MKALEAHELALSDIFCPKFDLSIPNYQRPYAWEEETAVQLLEDLLEALDGNPDEPYFLGSIVLVRNSDRVGHEVIDGQQRLTTLTILLALLRELTADYEVAANLEDMLREPGNVLQKLSARPRLTLRDRDRDFFRAYM